MRARGPGHAPFPRHGVLRVSDLVGPAVAPAAVGAALATRGIAVGDREVPVDNRVRALLAPTAAGTVVTLECRGGFRWRRPVVLRRLAATLDDLVAELDPDPRDARKSGQNRTERRAGGS